MIERLSITNGETAGLASSQVVAVRFCALPTTPMRPQVRVVGAENPLVPKKNTHCCGSSTAAGEKTESIDNSRVFVASKSGCPDCPAV